MNYVISTPSRPKGDHVGLRDTYSTSPGAYKRKEFFWSTLSYSKFDISCSWEQFKVCCREAKRSASLGKSKEKNKNEIFVPLTLSISCPILGSLPSFVVAESHMLLKVVASSKLLEGGQRYGRLTWRGGKVWYMSRVKSLKEYY